MKCYNCKDDIKKGIPLYKFVGETYCHACMTEYVKDECLMDAIDLWIEQNTLEVFNK